MNLYQLTLFGAVLLGSATLSAQSTYCSKLPVKPGKGVTVTGVVECDGKPVAGVKVSDGYEITKTDKKGAYYLKSKKQNPQVFITIPSGYEASREDAVPQFWADFTEPADKLERHDFKLNKVNQDKHAIIAITDVHLANQRNDVSIFSGPYLDVIREDVKSFNDQGIPVYTLNMGDSSWDIYWYAHNYTIGDFRNTLKEANYPTPIFTVMGNHDNDPATPEGPDTDFQASLPFQKAFGPRYYSFDIGKVHYVMLDNIKYKNEAVEQEIYPGIKSRRNYTEEFTPEQMEWLKKDLADVSYDTPIVIACHCPVIRPDGPDHKGYRPRLDGKSTRELLDIVKPYKDVHCFTGHSHRQTLTRTPKEEQNFVDHNISGTCASWWRTRATGLKNLCPDGTPAAYELMTVDGTDLKWEHVPYEYDRNRKFFAWDMNGVKDYFANNAEAQVFLKNHPKFTDYTDLPDNYIYLSLWDYDPEGSLKVTENGKELPVEFLSDENPLWALSYALRLSLWVNKLVNDGFGKPRKSHLARVRATTPDAPVEITLTDAFGKETKETLQRPAAFHLEYNSAIDNF